MLNISKESLSIIPEVKAKLLSIGFGVLAEELSKFDENVLSFGKILNERRWSIAITHSHLNYINY